MRSLLCDPPYWDALSVALRPSLSVRLSVRPVPLIFSKKAKK